MDPRLYNAAKLGNIDALNSLLQEDPFILEKVALSPVSETPLHIATLAAKPDFVREILMKRPEFAEELNGDGFSPLHIAAATGNMEIAAQLLAMESMGSRLCLVKDKWGRTPLHCAATKGRVEMVGIFLSKCHEAVQQVTDRGETAFHLAVKNNQYEVLKALVEKIDGDDADRFMNAKDCQGNTILHLAMAKDQVKAVNLLKNWSKQDWDVEEIPHQDEDQINFRSQKSQADMEITIGERLPLQPQNQSLKDRVKNSWVEAEDMILLVASLIATVTYQAGLAPPQTIWKQGMKLNFDCMFEETQKITLDDLTDKCPAFTFYLFMSFNTAGFFSAIFLIFLFRNKTFVAALLPTSLFCMGVTYIALSLTMSPNAITFLILYFITIMILVYILFAVNAIQALLHRAGSAGGKAVGKLGSKLGVKRPSSDLEKDPKLNQA